VFLPVVPVGGTSYRFCPLSVPVSPMCFISSGRPDEFVGSTSIAVAEGLNTVFGSGILVATFVPFMVRAL
jgi:hypothetical protein